MKMQNSVIFVFMALACVLVAAQSTVVSESSGSVSTTSISATSFFTSSLSLSDFWSVSSSSSAKDACLCTDVPVDNERVCLYVEDVVAPTLDDDDVSSSSSTSDEDDGETSDDDDDDLHQWRPNVREGACTQECSCEHKGEPSSESESSLSSSSERNYLFGHGGRCAFAVHYAAVCARCASAPNDDPYCHCYAADEVGVATTAIDHSALTQGVCVAVPDGALLTFSDNTLTLSDFDDAIVTKGYMVGDQSISFLEGDDIFVALPGSGMESGITVNMNEGSDRVKVFERAAVSIINLDEDVDAAHVAVGGYAEQINSNGDSGADILTIYGSVGDYVSVSGSDEVYVGSCGQLGAYAHQGEDETGDRTILVAATHSLFGNENGFDNSLSANGGVSFFAGSEIIYVRFAGSTRGFAVDDHDELVDAIFYSSAAVFGSVNNGNGNVEDTETAISVDGPVSALFHAGFVGGNWEIRGNHEDYVIHIADDVSFGALLIMGSTPKLSIGNNFVANNFEEGAIQGLIINVISPASGDGPVERTIQIGTNFRAAVFRFSDEDSGDHVNVHVGADAKLGLAQLLNLNTDGVPRTAVFESGARITSIEAEGDFDVVLSAARVLELTHEATADIFSHYLLCGTQVHYGYAEAAITDGALYIAPGSGMAHANYGAFTVSGGLVKRETKTKISWESEIAEYGIGCCYDAQSTENPSQITCPSGTQFCANTFEDGRRRRRHARHATDAAVEVDEALDLDATVGEYGDVVRVAKEARSELDSKIAEAMQRIGGDAAGKGRGAEAQLPPQARAALELLRKLHK